MNSRTLTGSLLIIGPIACFVGFAGWILLLGSADWSDTKAIIQSLGENVTGLKPLAMVGTLGLLLGVAGLGGIKQSMEGGPGHSIAGLGFLLMVIGMAGAVIETGLTLGTGEASSTAAAAAAAGAAESAASASAVASSLYSASQAIGASMTALAMLGFGLIGYGVLIQKNFHTVISALIIVAGVIGVVVASVDYQSQLMLVPYVAYPVLTLAMGIITVRSNN